MHLVGLWNIILPPYVHAGTLECKEPQLLASIPSTLALDMGSVWLSRCLR
jgi:hypothetical protein